MPGGALSIGLAALLFLAASGCSRYRWDDPVDAYNSFVLAYQRSDYKTVFSALSEGTQKRLIERAKEVSAASGGALKDDPIALLFSSTQKPQPVTSLHRPAGAVDGTT